MNFFVFLLMCLSLSQSSIIELNDNTFDSTINNNLIVLVEFYNSNCNTCKNFTSEYGKIDRVVNRQKLPYILARMDDIKYPQYSISILMFIYPGIVLYLDKDYMVYYGEQKAEAILEFIGKKTNMDQTNLTTEEQIKGKQGLTEPVCIFASSKNFEIDTYIKLLDKFENYEFYHASIELVKKVFPSAEEGNAIILHKDKTSIITENLENDNFLESLETYSRPVATEANSTLLHLVSKPFDKKVVCLFYKDTDAKSEEILSSFEWVAKSYRSMEIGRASCRERVSSPV